MIRPILIWPDSRLREKSIPVTEFGDALKGVVTDLVETLADEEGLGLAAIQIGDPRAVFILHPEVSPTGTLCVCVNPKVELLGTEGIVKEGCLSFPGVFPAVKRNDQIRLTYQDTDGKEHVVEVSGLAAVATQHETDHLNGITMAERVGKASRSGWAQKIKVGLRHRKNIKEMRDAGIDPDEDDDSYSREGYVEPEKYGDGDY